MTDLDELIAEARNGVELYDRMVALPAPDIVEREAGRNLQHQARCLADALEAATRERDAALAAIGRVAALASRAQTFGADEFGAFKRELLAALDGAPEPEWEYGYTDHGMNPMRGCQDFDTARACAQGMQEKVVRRRPAGPWLPVEGESCGD